MMNEIVTEEQEILDEAHDSKESLSALGSIVIGLIALLLIGTAIVIISIA